MQHQNMLLLLPLVIYNSNRYKEVAGKGKIICVCWVLLVMFSNVTRREMVGQMC